MTDVVIAAAARTAIGSYGKGLASVSPSALGAMVGRAAIDRAGLEPSQVEHVVFGNVIHTDAFDPYIARVVGINSGVPKEVPAYTVNRLCGTGLQAVVSGAQAIQTGEAEVVLAGGAESMSRGPYVLRDARWGSRLGHGQLIDSVTETLSDPFESIAMGITAENLSERDSISRERQDEFAVRSHQRASAARAEGAFDSQIVPVTIESRKGSAVFDRDEHIREDASVESMARLRPVFKPDGTVTAGNSSGMNDGAAALILMSADRAKELGAPVRARILAYGSCGVEPRIMGIGPVPVVHKVLARAGIALATVDVIELNEAFAAQSLAVIDGLGLDEDKVNPNGGAIALGHPIGATGAAITTKLLYEMERRDAEIGLVTLCIGGGQGIAMLLARE